MGIWMWEGNRKRMESSGFYLHLENKAVLIGVGIKMFPRPILDRYRQAVVDKKLGPELKKRSKKFLIKGMRSTANITRRFPEAMMAVILMRNFSYTMD
jgi:hypothetical protein